MDQDTWLVEEQKLVDTIRARLPELQALLAETTRAGFDRFYRLYHQSFKVLGLQGDTQNIVAALRALAPHRPLNDWFETIVRDGAAQGFDDDTNDNWLPCMRPVLEAYFHAREFLTLICWYGQNPDSRSERWSSTKDDGSPVEHAALTSGWAAVLYLYNMR
jgi:hypothetical protein